MNQRTISMSFQTRLASVDREARSIEAVLASETPAIVYDSQTRGEVDEILLMSGASFPNQVPLLDMHDRSTLHSVLGSVHNIRKEGELVGRLIFASGDKKTDSIWNKVWQGMLNSVSAGYRIEEVFIIPPNKTETVAGRTFTAGSRPLHVATRWSLLEVSVVPIGADPTAKMRAESVEIKNHFVPNTISERKENPSMAPAIHTVHHNTREVLTTALRLRSGMEAMPMGGLSAEELGNRAISIAAGLTFRGLVHEAIKSAGYYVDHDHFREAIDLGVIQQIFTDTINANILLGFGQEQDVTREFCYEASVPNFRNQERFMVEDGVTLDPLPRGGTAKVAEFNLGKAEEYRVARYAKSIIIDDQDYQDDNLGVLLEAPRLLGQAAAKLRGDLVFSILLENPNMADGVPVFDASRDNIGNSLLSIASLQQNRATMNSHEDDNGILRGARPDIIVTAEASALDAALLVKTINEVGGNVAMRVFGEPRLDRGVNDPRPNAEEIRYEGEPATRFLFSSTRRGIEIGYLHGQRTPNIRTTKLDAGEWGVRTDVKMDIGAKIIAPFWMFRNVGLSAGS